MLRESFSRILNEYLEASKLPIADHPLASFIRISLKEQLMALLPGNRIYEVKGSAGQGTWGKVPWIATFDAIITDKAQIGYYLTYLFKSDMTGFYLNLNQGVTDIQNRYRAKSKSVLEIKAADFRAQLGNLVEGYHVGPIDLGPGLPSTVQLYEHGSVCSIYYSTSNIPTEEKIINDYLDMLKLYNFLVDNDETTTTNEFSFAQSPNSEGYEDTTKKRKHLRIERNPKLVEQAKRFHGYACQICQFDFEKVYGEIGRGFIEAHHIVPLSQVKDQIVPLDPKKDFAVLCSNCHQMVHKLPDISEWKSLLDLAAKVKI